MYYLQARNASKSEVLKIHRSVLKVSSWSSCTCVCLSLSEAHYTAMEGTKHKSELALMKMAHHYNSIYLHRVSTCTCTMVVVKIKDFSLCLYSLDHTCDHKYDVL